MQTQVRNQDVSRLSSSDRALGACLVAASLFVFGYTATRVFLSQPVATASNVQAETVTPHQASLWSVLGE